MKTASAKTLAILAAGAYLKLEFYQFTLPALGTFYFTNADVPLTIGGVVYKTGLTIKRSAFKQALGLKVQSVDITIEPQADNPAGPVTLAGAGFLAACSLGGMDGGTLTISKGFFNFPAAATQLDTSPGIVPWFSGLIDQITAGRFYVELRVNDILQLLNVMMPRNILQSGCVHALFDAGCTLAKATYQQSAAITSLPSVNGLTASALTQASGYFALGVIAFTSGVLSGSSYTVKSFAAGVVAPIIPFASSPNVGDTFTIVPGCDKGQGTCTTKFANLAHYRGAPYVPMPETLYDGGTPNLPQPTLGGQGGQGAGSAFSGGLGKGTYSR